MPKQNIILRNNPFTSLEFTDIWVKHYNKNLPSKSFEAIKDVTFVKSSWLPLYINVGKNLTNAISYRLTDIKINELRNRVFYVYDVPGYLNDEFGKNSPLKVKRVRQYKGYLCDLQGYDSLSDYISDNFKSKSRRLFFKNKEKLEICFNIRYQMFFGDNITRETYDEIFHHFYKLLQKRYTQKRISNHYLSTEKWEYLREVVYPLILSKKANLFVTFNEDTPITISLNYISEEIAFGALTVFDTDYEKFNIGFIDIMKHIEWYIENEIRIFDFSKGDFDYKKRWGNLIYDFEYHILYRKSVISSSIANVLSILLKTKQYLREKNLHTLFHRITFFFNNSGQKKGLNNYVVERLDIKQIKDYNQLRELNVNDNNLNPELKRLFYSFLYQYSERYLKTKLFESVTKKGTYLVLGEKNANSITLC
ncbi:GNAT family N-acetyltransferase [Spongiivirga sp. MCCC 1A20706]|uniref:GNAT family N-acetyltransferase n=1 Tax=Spongiivirga sp. MCCC 1A20706 TaxID=3160963 RepID=UPI0039775ADE